MDEAMKKKTKTVTRIEAPPGLHALAERLFNIGMEGWRKVDKKKTPMKFDEIESPGQKAGWYAIAMYVESVMKEPF
jgi:hypothetical protein